MGRICRNNPMAKVKTRPVFIVMVTITALILWLAPRASAADLQPRSYPYLLSHASLVAVGKITGVSAGFMSDSRNAKVAVEGIIKGRLRSAEIKVAWNDKEFQETAYQDDARVVLFVILGKDSSWSQVAPGISCWPVEKIALKGKRARAVEYVYPMDLVTEIPSSAMGETEGVEKSMNFQVAKRKRWILTDALLPPAKALVLPKPPKPPEPGAAAKPKPAKPDAAVKAAKPSAAKKTAGGKPSPSSRKSLF